MHVFQDCTVTLKRVLAKLFIKSKTIYIQTWPKKKCQTMTLTQKVLSIKDINCYTRISFLDKHY